MIRTIFSFLVTVSVLLCVFYAKLSKEPLDFTKNSNNSGVSKILQGIPPIFEMWTPELRDFRSPKGYILRTQTSSNQFVLN